jgi:iron-siderophore transport system ATP-binding protein
MKEVDMTRAEALAESVGPVRDIESHSGRRLQAREITLGYGSDPAVIESLSLKIPDGKITSIIGPNGCGKSTLLRAMVRLLQPRAGAVMLDGKAIHRMPTKQIAREIGLLAQQLDAPEAITVEDLARRGRYPHKGFLQPPATQDRRAVDRALELTGMQAFRGRAIDELSGGQRQRAWIAMALAQETPLLLLDEPTTYLDLAHQQEVLELIQRLNRDEGRTIVMVVHDMNHAIQVSDHIVAMRDGAITASGNPDQLLAPELLHEVFGVWCDLVQHPDGGRPFTVARSSIRASSPSLGQAAIRTFGVSADYDRVPVLNDVSVAIPEGAVTAIVGPNGCGKSTLLRSIARLMTIRSGVITLAGKPAAEYDQRQFARQLGVLSQGATVPSGVVVEELVATARYPYQRWYRQWSHEDQQAIEWALEAAACNELRHRVVDELSGGQRQRVWLARALAQETNVLLLDEPTTFLDIAYQVEVLDLVRDLNLRQGRTFVLVLHDLCHACRYADHMIAMRDGKVKAEGTPKEIVTEQLIRDVFKLESRIVTDPTTGSPLVLPQGFDHDLRAAYANKAAQSSTVIRGA